MWKTEEVNKTKRWREMGRTERLQFIRAIERERSSRLLVYITGDRRGLETKIATDVFPFCLNHLSRIGHQKRIDLYLYSTGGVTMAGYGLVNLIKEFCDSFNVIIPFKALSCATLIALGADNIILTKMGQLSPIDPSVESPLGPSVPIPGQPGSTRNIPVNVEDAINFLNMAKEQLGLKDEESLVRVFDRLSESVHPLTLGNVNRIREQIGFLAKTLLRYHMDDENQIDYIVGTIIRGRFSHDYLIGRKEAKEVVRLPIIDVSEELDRNIINLYSEYDKLLSLSEPYHPETVLREKESVIGTFDQAIIESDNLTHVFRTQKEIKRIQLTPPQVPTPATGYLERNLKVSWVEDNSI